MGVQRFGFKDDFPVSIAQSLHLPGTRLLREANVYAVDGLALGRGDFDIGMTRLIADIGGAVIPIRKLGQQITGGGRGDLALPGEIRRFLGQGGGAGQQRKQQRGEKQAFLHL